MINLYCIHFAGGSRYSFNGFVKNSPSSVNVVPLELPGRGSRVQEDLLTDIDLMVEDIFLQVKDRLFEPFAIYGHSMGTLIGFLLVHRIKREGLPLPVALYVSGRAGPKIKYKKHRHNLPQQEFLKDLKEMGGIPDEMLADHNLIVFFEPIIRADFMAVETYQYEPMEFLNIPIYVFYGSDEGIAPYEAMTWQDVTSELIEVKKFSGHHFFIFEYDKEIMNFIAKSVEKTRQTTSANNISVGSGVTRRQTLQNSSSGEIL